MFGRNEMEEDNGNLILSEIFKNLGGMGSIAAKFSVKTTFILSALLFCIFRSLLQNALDTHCRLLLRGVFMLYNTLCLLDMARTHLHSAPRA